MNQQPLPSSADQFKRGVSIFVFLCRALALSVEVFLHRTGSFGERYIGLQAGATVLLIFFYPVFWKGHDPRPVLVFLGCYLFMNLCVRARTQLRRKRGGPQPHSLYTGAPWVLSFLPRMSEEKIKTFIEPMLVFLTGVFTMALNEPLGGYLLIASAGLLVSTNLTAGYERKRALDMHDAYVDGRGTAERFRDMRRD